MKKLKEALKTPEKLQKISEAVEKGKKAWEEAKGKAWTARDPIQWIKAWKESDSYEREHHSCFATNGSTVACSTYPLSKSVILDNAADKHFINDKSFFVELSNLNDRPVEVLVRDKVSEYRQVSIAEVPIRKPGGRQSILQVSNAKFIPTFYTSVILNRLLNEAGVFWNNEKNQLYWKDTREVLAQLK